MIADLKREILGRRPHPFVGRTAELARIAAALDPTTVDGPHALAVVGVPGIGKSSLIRHGLIRALEGEARLPVFVDLAAYDVGGRERAAEARASLWTGLLRSLVRHVVAYDRADEIFAARSAAISSNSSGPCKPSGGRTGT